MSNLSKSSKNINKKNPCSGAVSPVNNNKTVCVDFGGTDYKRTDRGFFYFDVFSQCWRKSDLEDKALKVLKQRFSEVA